MSFGKKFSGLWFWFFQICKIKGYFGLEKFVFDMAKGQAIRSEYFACAVYGSASATNVKVRNVKVTWDL